MRSNPRQPALCSLAFACAALLPACAPRQRPQVAPQRASAEAAPRPDLARGGRIFDDWPRALGIDFVADDPRTPAADGRGGPLGDGRLLDAHGSPLPNDGHDYRLVGLLGADLRGTHGALARCDHHGVLVPALLSDTDDAAHWRTRLHDGEDGIPAFGSVLDPGALDDLVAFLMAVRGGALPSPSALFERSEHAPCGVTFAAGDPAAGRALHADRCASCHGDDGRAFPLGKERQSLGGFVRSHAPRAWFVVLSGKAGTAMPPLLGALPDAALTPALRNLFGAYVDAHAFPDLAATP